MRQVYISCRSRIWGISISALDVGDGLSAFKFLPAFLATIFGLFLGAVVLAVGYKLFLTWLNQEDLTVDKAP